jgi:hypothetical protein
VKLTTHLHLVPRSRMRGTIPPLPQYVFMAWRLVQHRDSFSTRYSFHIMYRSNILIFLTLSRNFVIVYCSETLRDLIYHYTPSPSPSQVLHPFSIFSTMSLGCSIQATVFLSFSSFCFLVYIRKPVLLVKYERGSFSDPYKRRLCH